jgi:metallo-beta-lactamase family protein
MSFPIRLQFLGAYSGVTGSKTLLEWKNKRFLIDCGLFQGPSVVRQMNWVDLPIKADTIDAVFLTHAHLDHVGYLPRLYKQGFRGPIYCSEGTYDLAQIILMDSAYLEEEAAKYARDTQYSYHKDPQPLFTTADAEAVLKLFKPIPRYEWVPVADGVSIHLHRAGHIIGASLVEVRLHGDRRSKTFTFTGDVGHEQSLILKGPDPLPPSDVVILESTYGNRLHDKESALDKLGEFLQRAIAREGVVVIPAFAVGRSQEIIYMIAQLEQKGIIPAVPVILDSPMSDRALKIFFSHEEDQRIASSFHRNREFYPAKFETSTSSDQSMLTTMRDGPAIVISASGMLAGGRILHHLKKRLPDPRNMIVFSGYQAEGTKGRFLQDNSGTLKTLRIHHKEVELAAEVVTITNLSAHADYHQLITWLKRTHQKPQQVLINHGLLDAQDALAEHLQKELGWNAAPSSRQTSWDFL